MSKLTEAQRNWLRKLGAIVSGGEAISSEPPRDIPSVPPRPITEASPIALNVSRLGASSGAGNPRSPADIQQEIGHVEDVLNTAVEEARDTVWGSNAPHLPSDRGSIKKGLEQIARNKNHPKAAEAAKRLRQIEDLEEELAELQKELRGALKIAKMPAPKNTPDGGHDSGKGTTNATNKQNPAKPTPEEPHLSPKTPPKTPPATPKTPATPKSPPTSGDTGAKPPGSTVTAVEKEFELVSKEVGLLRKAGKNLVRTVKLLASPAVQGLLQLIGGVLRALAAIDGVQSALAGGGFVFKDTVAQVNNLASQVSALVNGYRQAGYHKALDEAIDLAAKIDKMNPEGLYGSDELSTFCAQVRPDIEKHESECQDLLDEMKQIESRANAGRKLCESLLDNVAFLVAADLTGDDLTLFMAYMDFGKISSEIRLPIYTLDQHLTPVHADVKRVNDHIIGGFFLDE
jgi:hypothetical protein